MHQGSSIIPICHALLRCLHCHPRPPSRHSSNITTVYTVPALHLHLLSHPSCNTMFFRYYPFAPCAQTIQYSLICPTVQLPFYTSSPTHLLIPNSTSTKLLKHFISRTFAFLLSALLKHL